MTTIKITPEIESLVAFAKSIKFDVVNGDMKELARLWYLQCIEDYRFLSDKDNWFSIYNALQNRCNLR
jgi:hypothetical protein